MKDATVESQKLKLADAEVQLVASVGRSRAGRSAAESVDSRKPKVYAGQTDRRSPDVDPV